MCHAVQGLHKNITNHFLVKKNSSNPAACLLRLVVSLEPCFGLPPENLWVVPLGPVGPVGPVLRRNRPLENRGIREILTASTWDVHPHQKQCVSQLKWVQNVHGYMAKIGSCIDVCSMYHYTSI